MKSIISILTITLFLILSCDTTAISLSSKVNNEIKSQNSLAGNDMKNDIVNHKLHVTITPSSMEIIVVDSIQIKGDFDHTFLLNAALTPFSNSKNITLVKLQENVPTSDVGMDMGEQQDDLKANKWQIKFKGGKAHNNFVISYRGKVIPETEKEGENYQRGFTEITGVISEEGVYLAGSSYWVPLFENRLMTYELTTVLPTDWQNVSQGKRVFDRNTSDNHTDKWVCDKPQEEILLIAAKFTEYSYEMTNGVMAMAFLRTPDEGLANKYLEVTEQYMNMYESMLGTYPYSKFALVENFWETGYGMPSFTLLGEKIIRFPFILHSSYPHELLHNWWGNSVYVDFDSGNWCEGITAFMADHLIKEQRGAGEEYRRSVLQKYSNYVTPENDFPLSKFISRTDGPSESIGYGKALMMWQMLRRKLGDEIFIKGMKLFNDNYKYKIASYDDIRTSMEEASGNDLQSFFTQWTTRTGAPQIDIKDYKTNMYNGKHSIVLTLEQTQDEDVFEIDVPVHILTGEGKEFFVFNMNKRVQEFQINLSAKPEKLHVDPQYDVFRILGQEEAPPTLSKIWGSKENIIILPKKADPQQLAIYEELAEQWKAADNDDFVIKYDTEISELPIEKTHWIFGVENKFAELSTSDLVGMNVKDMLETIILENRNTKNSGISIVFTLFDKTIPNKQNIFIATDNKNAIPGLVRKLPHYGKYSYLAFEGDEPTNIDKRQWPVLKSPLIILMDEAAQSIDLKEDRKALATLPAVFSEKKMMANIEYLASEELKGRGIGTPEIDMAADHIAAQFKAAGLQPYGESYFQKFSHIFPEKGKLDLTNVIGVIPGIDPEYKDDPVVVSAHYDHLGMGWPDVHKGDEGKLHYGADDNASGVATIIELARSMAKTARPKRTIIFLACTAEEAGLIGSRYFVEHSKEAYKGDIFANVNIDTDGSLYDKKLLVLNANSAKEWKFIFMGTDYTTGIKSEVIEKQLDASDQMAFIEKGIPAVQLFTGPTENYHRPTDTYDKIDGKGLVKVATVTKEVIGYLAERTDPMNYTGGAVAKSHTSPAHPKTSRKVSTGTVPDFAYKGTGVRVGAVIDGSAGSKAGLLEGDIITGINGIATDDLKQYSDMLKKFKPDDIIRLDILRDSVKQTIKIKLGSR